MTATTTGTRSMIAVCRVSFYSNSIYIFHVTLTKSYHSIHLTECQWPRPKAFHFRPELYRLLLGPLGSGDQVLIFLLQISSDVVWQTRDLHLSRNTLYLLSPRLCVFIVLKCHFICLPR